MRLFDKGPFWTPVRNVLDGLIVIVVVLFAAQALLMAVLVVNPQHTLRQHFHVSTLAGVPDRIWPADGLVHVAPGTASATVEPWAFIVFRPVSRVFVLVVAAVALAWRALVVVVFLQLRWVLTNISAGAPFPRDNIRRVRIMGWAILGMAATDLLIDAGMIAYMRMAVTVADEPATVPFAMLVSDFPIGTVLAGLAVVILAGIFRAGADLQDEQALTV